VGKGIHIRRMRTQQWSRNNGPRKYKPFFIIVVATEEVLLRLVLHSEK